MFTFVADDFSWEFLVAAFATEDLSTDSTVVSSPEGRELVTTVVALAAAAVRHPVLLEVAVLVRLGGLV